MIVYAINNYVWELLKKNLDWQEIKGLVPILPAQQQPEFLDTDAPFIVYTSSNEFNDGELEPLDVEVISYVIFSEKSDEVDDAVTLIKNAFKAFNSAENINLWIHNPACQLDPRDKVNLVTWTQVMNTESSGAAAAEGEKVDGFVSVRVGYHTNPQDYSI